jgi:hypothetical protein
MKTAFCLLLVGHLVTGSRYRAREYLEEEPITWQWVERV